MKEKVYYNVSTGKTETKNIVEDFDYDEFYKDTIWENNVYGYKVRVRSWFRNWYNDCCYDYNIYFTKPDGEKCKMDMREFNYLYKKIGKAKYKKNEIDQMIFQVKEEE